MAAAAALALLALALTGCVPGGLLGAASVRPTDARAAPATATPTPARKGPLDDRIIVLDPGHGGHSGAMSAAGVWEDDNVLQIAEDAAALLRKAGARVHLTRTGPHLLGSEDNGDLTARVADAARWHAQVFVSIHQNYSDDTRLANGMETFYSNPDAKSLADDLQEALVAGTGLVDGGVRTDLFWVTSCNPMPAVLIEGGFMSNAPEAGEISTPAFHRKEARAIAAGLRTYFATPGAVAGPRPLPEKAAMLCAMTPPQARAWVDRHKP